MKKLFTILALLLVCTLSAQKLRTGSYQAIELVTGIEYEDFHRNVLLPGSKVIVNKAGFFLNFTYYLDEKLVEVDRFMTIKDSYAQGDFKAYTLAAPFGTAICSFEKATEGPGNGYYLFMVAIYNNSQYDEMVGAFHILVRDETDI